MNSIPDERGGASRCSVRALLVAPGETEVDHLVRLADAAMYRAKSGGASLQLELLPAAPSAVVAGRGRGRPRLASSTLQSIHLER